MSSTEKELEARIAELEGTVERLTATVAHLTRRPAPGQPAPDGGVDRRTVLRLAAAAAGGAVVAPLALAGPAAADNGNAIIIGALNTTTPGNGANTVLDQTPTAGGAHTHFQVRHSAADPQPTGVEINAPLWGTGSTDGEGILGWAPGSAGFGVYGTSNAGFGVVGQSDTGVDILAFGTGRLSQVDAFVATGGPPAYESDLFETVRDDEGVVWLSGTAATGGPWRRANSVIPISPIRVWDSRNAGGAPAAGVTPPPGAVQGPFNAGTTVTLSLAGYQGLPTAISGLVCVLTVITPATAGFIRAFPGGATPPLAVVGNFAPGAIVSFYPTVATGTATPNAGRLSVQVGAGTNVHIGLDITAYLV